MIVQLKKHNQKNSLAMIIILSMLYVLMIMDLAEETYVTPCKCTIVNGRL